jgi:two-component system, cell cycle response regulator
MTNTPPRTPSPKPPTPVRALNGVSICLLEDDAVTRRVYTKWLKDAGAVVHSFASLEEFQFAFDAASGWSSNLKIAPRLALIDLVLPDGNGVEAVELWRRLLPQNPVLVCTAFATVENAIEAMKKGAFDFLRKPINEEELVLVLQKALQHADLLDQNKVLQTSLQILQMAQTLAATSNKLELLKTLGRLLYRESGCTECFVYNYSASKKTLDPLLDLRFVGRPRRVPEEVVREALPDLEKWMVDAPENLATVDFNDPLPYETQFFADSLVRYVLLKSPSGNFGLILLQYDPTATSTSEARFQDLPPLCMQGARTYQSLDVASVLSFVDELTGLYNQRYLEVALANELAKAQRYNSKFSLAFLDLDKFKSVNDTHGHLVGSQTIKEAAKILRQTVRDSDYVLRYGGDEFCAILPGASLEGALLVTERIRQTFESSYFNLSESTGVASATRIHVTTSIGIACFPDSATTIKDLIQLADEAMYQSKKGGRNQVSTPHRTGTSI